MKLDFFSFQTITFISFFICICIETIGQKGLAPAQYMIEFTDKPNTTIDETELQNYFSSRAFARREKYDILFDKNDYPVNQEYIDSLRALNLTILYKSKWLNAVVIQSVDTLLLDTLHNISFILDNRPLQSHRKTVYDKIEKFKNPRSTDNMFDYVPYDNYGEASNQLKMLMGHVLHRDGYRGEGLHIAVIDAGFDGVDELPVFDSIRVNNRILGGWDFVENDYLSYSAHYHGTSVLSIMAGNLKDKYLGTAPQASYLLLRTEDASSEYLIEEFLWILAAEYSDSAGVDIICTSLGYEYFDDSTQNHTYCDMNGINTIISWAALIAARKGILVVTSAGNSGSKSWKYITAPADADSIIAVGAVNSDGDYAKFSSQGPTVDGRTKPEVVAQGVSTSLQKANGTIGNSSGTSYAAPLIAGLSACLWQRYPDLNNMAIRQKILESSEHYENPDFFYGYGIPDFALAAGLEVGINNLPEQNPIIIAPNPFHDTFSIHFENIYNTIIVTIFDTNGRKLLTETHEQHSAFHQAIEIQSSGLLSPGVYIVKIALQDNIHNFKLLKTN
jgi:hypothetical protein